MPLYNYRCTECGQEFEVLGKYTDEQPCGCGGKARHVFRGANFRLIGGGFYKNEYKTNQERNKK